MIKGCRSKITKRLILTVLVIAMLFSIAIPALAIDTPEQAIQVATDMLNKIQSDVQTIFQTLVLFPNANMENQLLILATQVHDVVPVVVQAGTPVLPLAFSTLDNVDNLVKIFSSPAANALGAASANARAAFLAIPPDPPVQPPPPPPPPVDPPVQPPPPPVEPEPPETLTVNPTRSTILVNGVAIDFEAYLIHDENYFKLRDLAYVLTGTEKQFSTSWDEEARVGALTSGQPYEPTGQEMILGDGLPKTATLNTGFFVMLDGEKQEIQAYLIGDNNFVRIRDILRMFDIGWTFNDDTKEIGIITSEPYSE